MSTALRERVARILTDVECLPWRLRSDCFLCEDLDLPAHDKCVLYIQAMLERPDTESRVIGWGYGTKYWVDPAASDDTLIKVCFRAVDDYGHHEVREAFLWKGRRVLGPHVSLDTLHQVIRS